MQKRRFILLVIIILFFHVNTIVAQGSWKIIRQIDTLTIYKDVDFVDKNNGWVVGYLQESLSPPVGIILHTCDGGVTWYYQKQEKGLSFWNVQFVDSLTGWVLADSNVVFHTYNGGRTWNRETWKGYFFFITSKKGWRINDGKSIFYTNNGAKTWTHIYTHPSASLSMICFVDSLNGWVMQGMRTIFHTRDGGHTWEEQYSCSSCSLRKWKFINSLKGWVLAFSDPNSWMILKTIDGGNIWDDNAIGSAWYYSDISFVDSLQGWIVGALSQGVSIPVILHTSDGGGTWTSQDTKMGEMGGLYALCFIDSCTGWAVGIAGGELAIGTILKYACTINAVEDKTTKEQLWLNSHYLLQSYPNPFNASTKIRFYIHQSQKIIVSVYDINGQLVKELIKNEVLSPGYHEVQWDGKDQKGNVVASGIYLCALESRRHIKTIKLVAIK